MRISSLLAPLTFLVASTFRTPAVIHPIETFGGETTGRFLVTVKPNVWKAGVINQMKPNSRITNDWDILNGFASYLDEDTVNALRANPDVESVAEDGIITNAPWGPGRLSSTTKFTNTPVNSLTFNYTYDASADAGADIYIIDTGIVTTLPDFGGRASWGETFGLYADADSNGHGTQCASIAGGTQFGVAKLANLIAVKVLSDAGSGAVSDIVSGLNFVIQRHAASGRPSLSLRGSVSSMLDNAVASLTASGVHIAVAAGNSNTDTGTISPARAPSAITVGATAISDARASFSNFGSAVDTFAPGQDIISNPVGGNASEHFWKFCGLNVSPEKAACHVAGLIAYLLGLRGDMTPESISTLIKSLRLKNVLSGIPFSLRGSQ